MKNIFFFLLCFLVGELQAKDLPYLKVLSDGHFLITEKGEPFFWLGDTGWLLAQKLMQPEVAKYLDNRKAKGFNVIQMMVLHNERECNASGDSALVDADITRPKLADKKYDYWAHLEWIVDEAGKRGMYVALVPIWGSVEKKMKYPVSDIRAYMQFLCVRFSNKKNLLWLVGGDIKGSSYTKVFETVGATIKQYNPKQLVSFHPFGRTQSSTWFHTASWLDFNIVQSGHRNYAQDPDGYGEDNWKYIQTDYAKTPVKPALDGEPSYEGIPQGLHDTLQPRWTAADVRRYAYWSVFAGGCGITYGNNSVMQFYMPGAKDRDYGATEPWTSAINNEGAGQMQYLKKLILSKSYFERNPDQSLILGQGEKYDYVIATRGKSYAFIYTFTGRNFTINGTKQLKSPVLKASWYNPRTGKKKAIGTFQNNGDIPFDPPGEPKNGNDWVLVLEGK